MKKKRRYNTANDIRDDIERYKRKAVQCLEQAEELEREVKRLVIRDDPKLAELIGFKREQAKKLRKKSNRIMDKKMQHLKEKLAEWSTPPLPGTGVEGRDIQS